MLSANALSIREQDLTTNSTKTKSSRNYGLGSSLAIPWAALAWLCVNSPHSALAVDLNQTNSQTSDNNLSFTNSSSITLRDPWNQEGKPETAIAESKKTGIFPRIVSLIANSWQQQPFDLFGIWVVESKTAENNSFRGVGGSFTQDFGSLYLSRAESPASQEFWTATKLVAMKTPQLEPLAAQNQLETYSVKTGDTISRIAQKFRVSKPELIALNQIKNSNIIFVNQKLKIPAHKISNPEPNFGSITANLPQNAVSSPIASTTPIYLADSRIQSENLAKVETTAPNLMSNEERIARLRADIDQMRDQYRAEIKQQQSLGLAATDNIRTRDQELPLLNSSKISTAAKEAHNNQTNTLEETAMAFNLPPLPAAEEYLPDAFDGYAWPARGVLTSGYGWRWGRLHKGIDIAAPVGTPVFAAAGGRVISAGWNSGGYGNLVKLQHLDGSVTLYAHNNRVLVASGQEVSKGEQIAEMGSTGFSTGSHLHFEIHTQNQGIVDPMALLSTK